nr:hypothetical protein [Neobacillus sp. 179.-C4.2 HS]
MTLDRAKKEIMRLQDYVDLVESYQPKSIDQEIVKEYALTSSINEVSKRLSVSYEKVVEVISSLGKDELHKMVRSAYMKKTKHSRSWY